MHFNFVLVVPLDCSLVYNQHLSARLRLGIFLKKEENFGSWLYHHRPRLCPCHQLAIFRLFSVLSYRPFNTSSPSITPPIPLHPPFAPSWSPKCDLFECSDVDYLVSNKSSTKAQHRQLRILSSETNSIIVQLKSWINILTALMNGAQEKSFAVETFHFFSR